MSQVIQKINKLNLELLFKEHSEGLYYHALAIVNCEHVAKDIVQDAYIYVWNNRNKIDTSYSLKALLYKIVRNNSLNILKHQKVQNKYSDYIINTTSPFEKEPDESELILTKVDEALKLLPPRSRQIIEKCFLEGKRYKEVAEELEISINTVKSHITAGLKSLRKVVKKDFIFFFAFFK